jgi:hypothetical protein
MMTADFWLVIGSNPMSIRSNVDAAIARIGQRLHALELRYLETFQELLLENLEALNLDELASTRVDVAGVSWMGQTADHFLYARCACVLAGEEAVRGVLSDPALFSEFVSPRLQSAEALLYVARTEYHRRTGEFMPDMRAPN